MMAMDIDRLRRMIEQIQDQDGPFDHITDPEQKLWLETFAQTGHRRLSYELAGIPNGRHNSKWKDDLEFQEAYELAQLMAAEHMEDEAVRRAVHGMKQYKFTKDGTPLKHPDECTCGHIIQGHLERKGPCTVPECDCASFHGRPYYEHAYSDRLLSQLLRGNLPKYADRSGGKFEINIEVLPHSAIDRLAKGEHPLEVLVSILETHPNEVRAALGQDVKQLDPAKEIVQEGGQDL